MFRALASNRTYALVLLCCTSCTQSLGSEERPYSPPLPDRPARYPIEVVCPAACVVGDYIYVTGGYGNRDEQRRADFVGQAHRYDLASNTWQRLPDMPRKRCFHAAVAAENKVWVFGGFDRSEEGERNIAEVHCFDPRTMSWSTACSLPTPRNRLGAAVLDGRVYVVGGMADDGDCATVEVLDLETLTWIPAAAMPQPMHGHALAAVPGGLLTAGGSRGLERTWLYDAARDAWSPGPKVPGRRLFASAVNVGGSVHLLGNRMHGEIPHLRYDPEDTAWKQIAPRSIETHRAAAVLLAGCIYVIGGERRGGELNRVSRYSLKTGRWVDSL